MGLLDSLFNQSTYGGDVGGLLGLLRNTQMQQDQYQPSAGFPGQASPIAVGNYQMPRVGDTAQFTPPPADPAALPVNAQPVQGQLPQQQPQGFGGFLQSLNENFQNMGNGGSLIGALTGQRPNSQTAQFLASKGIDPAMAQTIASDPTLLRSVLPSVLGTGGLTDDIKEYQFAKREDPSLTFNKFMSQKKSVSGEYGLQGIWGTKDGKPALIQLGKGGEAVESKLPPGFQPAKDPVKIDAGTHWVLIDPQTRQPIAQVPKNLQEKEAAEAKGKIQGEAQGELPAVEMQARRTIDKIDEFANGKGFNEVFGALDQFRPNWTMSDDGRNALTKFNGLAGSAFLEGRQMLKGGGAITDFESKKAEAAIARLDRSLSEKDARQALEEFKDAVRAGAEKLRAKANGATSVPAPSAAPAGLPAGWSVKVR